MLLKVRPNEKDHILGNIHAPVSIVQYGDYECSICARNDIWIKRLVKEFDGSICYVFRNFPLTYIHPHSAVAAVAAEAASKHNKFWEMHELLMKNYNHLGVENILTFAERLGLDRETFFHELESSEIMDDIINEIMNGQESGVETSPAYFVNGTKLFGIVNYDTLRNDIQHLLPELRAH